MKQFLILDEETYIATQATLAGARRACQVEAEALHQRGLLLSPAVRRQVQVTALVALERDLARWAPHEMLRRIHRDKPGTPADMHEAMMGYLADYIKALKEER